MWLSSFLSLSILKYLGLGLVGNAICLCLFSFFYFGNFLVLGKEKKEHQINISCSPAQKSLEHRYSILLSKLWSGIDNCNGSLRSEENSHSNLFLVSCIHYTFKYMYIHEHIIEVDIQVVYIKSQKKRLRLNVYLKVGF